MCDADNSVARMKFHGRTGGSTFANTIFRLANKFSKGYYQSDVELGACRAPLHGNQLVARSNVLNLRISQSLRSPDR